MGNAFGMILGIGLMLLLPVAIALAAVFAVRKWTGGVFGAAPRFVLVCGVVCALLVAWQLYAAFASLACPGKIAALRASVSNEPANTTIQFMPSRARSIDPVQGGRTQVLVLSYTSRVEGGRLKARYVNVELRNEPAWRLDCAFAVPLEHIEVDIRRPDGTSPVVPRRGICLTEAEFKRVIESRLKSTTSTWTNGGDTANEYTYVTEADSRKSATELAFISTADLPFPLTMWSRIFPRECRSPGLAIIRAGRTHPSFREMTLAVAAKAAIEDP